MSQSRSDVDDDFAEFVRARQHELVRAAYLVCGDAKLAHEVTLGAFVSLAHHWSRIQDESPDTYVRSVLYRDAISVRHSGSHALTVIDQLSPKQRAVTVLRHFEHRSEDDTAEILGSSVGAVRSQAHAGDGLDGLLADAAESVTERDLVDAAWFGARVRRHRRRRLGWAALAGVAVLATAVVLNPRDAGNDDVLPAPGPSTSSTPLSTPFETAWDASAFDLSSVTAQVGPTAVQVGALPKIDDLTRSQLALPDVLTFGPETELPVLREVGNNSAPVRAVLLRHTPEGLHPVLVRPTLTNPFMEVDTLDLARNIDEAGNTSEPLEVKAIADDRRHVMFIQSGKVLVLDAFSGEVTSLPVPDKYLEGGGWTPDGTAVIVWSETYQWRVTPATKVVQRLGRAAYPGRHQIVAVDNDVRVLGYDGQGANTETLTGPRVFSGIWGSTFTNVESRVATGGFLSQAAAMEANTRRPMRLFQGVLTVDSSTLVSARLLIAPGSEGVATGCCEVLGWAFKDQILIRWNGRDLLAWDVRSGGLRRVSTLPVLQESPQPGSAARAVALAP